MSEKKISMQQLGEISLYDAESMSIRMRELWRKKVAVLVFVRHFG